ncbi:MAG: DUF4430 domain-containing protein [Thermoleophilaceae bacterium]
MARRAMAGLLAAVALAAVTGCGAGTGREKPGGRGVQLRVTRDFGERRLSQASAAKVREGQKVLRFLRGSNKVTTRPGGGVVQSIDGLPGKDRSGGEDWFFYVNGIASDRGAGDYDLHPGDVVQWDYRYWRAAHAVRATVGAFPEPFLHGIDGKRFPVRVECEDAASEACREVKDTLRAEGVPATGAALGTAGVQNVARVVVATWSRARELLSVKAIEQGPKRSGVFARYVGRDLELLDQRGKVARTEGADSGLVAALRPTDKEVVWVVTGGSARGVQTAARAFRPTALRDAFAVAVPARGATVKLPVGAGR